MVSLAFAICLDVLASASSAPHYRVVDLENLPNGKTAYATALNNRGEVVGIADDGTGHTQAVLWNSEGKIKLLDPATANAHQEGGAYSINDLGQITGFRMTGLTNTGKRNPLDGVIEPILWRDGRIESLGTPTPMSTVWMAAGGVNALGWLGITEANAHGGTGNFREHPHLPRSWFYQIDTHKKVKANSLLPDSFADNTVSAHMNDQGDIAVVTDKKECYLWSKGRLEPIRSPNGQAIRWATSYVRGSVLCGTARDLDDDTTPFDGIAQKAFVWRDGTSRELPSPPHATNVLPARMNSHGCIVGCCYLRPKGEHEGPNLRAVLWNNFVLSDLTDLVEVKGLLLRHAVGINEKGWIAGDGERTDAQGKVHSHAYLLIPVK